MAKKKVYNFMTGQYEDTGEDIEYNFPDGTTGSTYNNNIQLPADYFKAAVPAAANKVSTAGNTIGTGLGGNSYLEYLNQDAFGGLGIGLTKGGLQDIGMGANILGTGYDLYSNLFGDKHDMFKTQMSALKQNMANIAQDRANHQTYVNNIGGGFNSAFGKGLAASAATKL